jgi:hypothetical protein
MPVQAVSQQTPLVQLPLAQSALFWQFSPSTRARPPAISQRCVPGLQVMLLGHGCWSLHWYCTPLDG